MGFFSRRSAPSNSAQHATGMVGATTIMNPYIDPATRPARGTEAYKEYKRLQKELRKQAKAAEKERKQAAKRAMKAMKEQVKQARQLRKRQEKETKRQSRIMRKMQKKEERVRRKLLRKRQKEAKRLRRRQKRQQRQQPTHPIAPTIPEWNDPLLQATTTQPPQESVQPIMNDTTRPTTPPVFKESDRCLSCASTFSRFPIRFRHHCRNCGDSFCSHCMSSVKRAIPWFALTKPQKVCYTCDVRVFHGRGGAVQSPPPSSTTISTVPTVREPNPAEESMSNPNPASDGSDNEVSPSSGSRLRIKLRSRSRRDNTSSKSKKNSIWNLPIRPLLKRKESRNRFDLDLHMEKADMMSRQRNAIMLYNGTITRGTLAPAT